MRDFDICGYGFVDFKKLINFDKLLNRKNIKLGCFFGSYYYKLIYIIHCIFYCYYVC